MASYDFAAAANHFQSAALFTAVAAAAGVAASALASSAGGVSGGESAGYQGARGWGVQTGAAESLGYEADRREAYAQKWDVTIVNPIGTEEWVENNLVPELRKVAKRDTEITVTFE